MDTNKAIPQWIMPVEIGVINPVFFLNRPEVDFLVGGILCYRKLCYA